MMVNFITFGFESRGEFKDIALSLCNEYSYLFPWWVNRVSIIFDDDIEYAFCNYEPEYRNGVVMLSTRFFSYDDPIRRDCIQHEFIHAVTAPYHNFVTQRILEAVRQTNEGLYNELKDHCMKLNEALTQDMTIALNSFNRS